MDAITAQSAFILAGIIFIFFAIVGFVWLPKTGAGPYLEKWTRILLTFTGVIFIGAGIFIKWQSEAPEPTVTPTISQASTHDNAEVNTTSSIGTSTSAMQTDAQIVRPAENERVPMSIIVSGWTRNLPADQYLWVVCNPESSPGNWWPQGEDITEDEWSVETWIGQQNEAGKKFTIGLALVNKEGDQKYREYLINGKETGNFPGIPLPGGAKILDQILVIRT